MIGLTIGQLGKATGTAAETIRYYESIGLLPPPDRADNNYRYYTTAILDRLRFIASARSLGFGLSDIQDLLAARDTAEQPCERVLDALDAQLATLDQRIADLLALREDLRALRAEGERRPRDMGASGQCVCYLVTAYRDGESVAIQRQEVDGG